MFREGQKIGPYTLVRKLGKGGFGEVWLAEKRTELVTKKVAIKLPLEEQVNLEAIKKEASLWEQASGHPNVLPIIDADIYDGQVLIVSEYADGGSLHEWLKKNGRKAPSIEKAVDLMMGILSGLVHLHSHKITHRDLKPSNILLHGDTPRITDFGIARVVEHSSRGTEALGTPMYMAPEAFRKSTSPKTDIWSAGVVFYEMLSGNCPFYDDDLFAIMDAIRSDEPNPLPEQVPEELQKIVKKALQKNPEDRFQTAREMREELLNFRQTAGQKSYTEKTTARLDEEEGFSPKTPKRAFFETLTLPLKGEFSNSVETKQKLPERKSGLPITIIAISLTLLIGIGGYSVWLSGLNGNKAKENPPVQSGNISQTNETIPAPTPLPTISSPVLPNTPNTQSKSIDKSIKPTSTRQSKSPSKTTTQPQPISPPVKPRPKPSPKKKVTFEDLIKDGNSQ